MRLTQFFGGGITPDELRRILRQCKDCTRFVYLERQGLHHCGSTPELLFNPDGFQIASSLLSLNQNSGIHAMDLCRFLVYCGYCGRICLEGALDYHTCSDAMHPSV